MVPLGQLIILMFIMGLLYGIYVITACYANRWLFFADEGWKRRESIGWVTAIMTNVIAALILASMVLSVHVAVTELNFVAAGHQPKEWSDPHYVSIVKCMISNTVALLADTILMYRLWVMTRAHSKWIMWFPILLWLGGIVCTILQLFLLVAHIHNPNLGPYQWAAVNMTVGPGIVLVPFWASTIALNAYCTGILVWRIWKASKRTSHNSFAKQLQFLVRVFLESGALYLLISLAHFFAWFGKTSDFSIYLFAEMNLCVIAIAFNLILIRIAQNKAEGDELGDDHEKVTTFQAHSRIITSDPTGDPNFDSHDRLNAKSKSSQDTRSTAI